MVNKQNEITSWFDETYTSKGFDYLRSVEAYEIFVRLLEPNPNSKHLDVACGLGLLLKALEGNQVETYGVDISPKAIEVCKEYCPNAHVQVANAEQLPFESNFFDSVSCIGSLERMLDRNQALREQIRVAKKGAKICYMVRNSENFTWKYFQKPLNLYNKKGHQDALNKEKWEKLFSQNELKVKAIYPDHWPYVKTIKTLLPWVKVDAGKIRKFPFNLELAYEFIFLLEKS